MDRYTVTGMSCAACAARVEKAVSAVDGVSACSVSLLTNSMTVEGEASYDAVKAAVERAGYGAAEQTGRETPAPHTVELPDEVRPLIRRFVVSLVVLVVLLYFSMGHMMFSLPLPAFFDDNHIAIGIVELLLCGVIMVINRRFFVSGVRGAIHRAPNMDTLVSLGSAASFLWSAYALLMMTRASLDGDMERVAELMDTLYFESAAMILVLITLGKMLEARAKGRTTSALRALMDLSPKSAVIERDGAEHTVPVEQVAVGDIFVVRPGAHIPVDGTVLEGSGAVDESMLTGESIPAEKNTGDTVYTGTVNRGGFLRCRAARVGEDTTLSGIIRTVYDASSTKAPIARIADRVSGVFVPVVIGIALVTAAVWLLLGSGAAYALERGIAVLVISCPCALGLATPVSIMVANGVGARSGILFKTAEAVETAGRTRIVALDKTGTITRGEPSVTDVLPCDGVSRDELLRVAYALEHKSSHPLALAVTAYAEQEQIPLCACTDFSTHSAGGLSATLDGAPILAGNVQFLLSRLSVPDEMQAAATAFSHQGKSVMLFAWAHRVLGLLAAADTVKDDSCEAIADLAHMGVRTVMITGDNALSANAVKEAVGIDRVYAGVLPTGKNELIERLRTCGRVAMVGDGINDAPALTTADTGIAIGSGTDIAKDAGDIVLVNSRLSDAVAAIRLSRRALRNIHQNLFWAFIYNIIGIPLAAGVWIPLFGWELSPMFAAAAMSLSSFCVVTNALRLNLFDPHKRHRNEKRPPVDLWTDEENEKGEDHMIKTTVKVEGMMCHMCEKHVDEAIERQFDVESVTSSHEAGETVIMSASPLDTDALIAAISDAGYKGVSAESEEI